MRLAWARLQRDRGAAVWSTPPVHTWDAWLARQWRAAVQRGTIPPAQLLSPGQERPLWEMELARRAGEEGDPTSLTVHAGALMNSAARATQARLVLSGAAQTQEEQLLVECLAAVRATCAARGLLSLRLSPAESLGFLAETSPPLFVGVEGLTAQQAWLGARHWQGSNLLLPLPAVEAVQPRLVRAGDPRAELAACAAWCRTQLERDTSARLLVLTAASEPSVGIQARQLWQALSADPDLDEAARALWLSVEGAEPLPHQGVVADALLALGLADCAEGVEISDLLALLRSPYFNFGTIVEAGRLAAWLGDAGLARMDATALRQALEAAAPELPLAQRFARWLGTMGEVFAAADRQGCTEWAMRFTAALAAGGFAAPEQLDARDLRVLQDWHALLDELARLDAVLAPLPGREALARLRQLAQRARHQEPAADAAITFSGRLTDPVAHYDGIWVLGVAENRWPAAPRPDAWVPLAEQRRAAWAEASVSDRRRQAQWALQCWQRRAHELVLSYARQEGDVRQRPTSLVAGEAWADAVPDVPEGAVTAMAVDDHDQQLPALSPAELAAPLPGGALRLDTQQDCPFRAQARWRLGAEPPAALDDGVPARVRGRLLHALLDDLWRQLGNQAALLALDGPGQERLLAASWQKAVRSTREAAWLAPGVLGRERARALNLVSRVLELERQRSPFEVRHREHTAQWQGAGARLKLRIDRIDMADGQAVLLDYKSGSSAGVKLQEGELRPLQLALYADALGQQQQAVAAAALLSLQPGGCSFAGVTSRRGLLPGRLHEAPDWEALHRAWDEQLQRLMAAHVAGEATLAHDRKACRHCHLPALCRRAGPDAADDAAAETDDD